MKLNAPISETIGIAKTLQKESVPQPGHGDVQSYNDCWRFLISDLEAIQKWANACILTAKECSEIKGGNTGDEESISSTPDGLS